MNRNKIILYALYAIVVVLIVYVVYTTKGFGIWKNKQEGVIKTGNYQAVFLSNGQVYFGQFENMNSKTPILSDIYYLQVQQVQPKDDSAKQNQKVTLIKLGNELHGPVDKMYINRDQILFWEDLKEDGKVLQAIKKYKEEGPNKTDSNSGSTVVPEGSSPTQ